MANIIFKEKSGLLRSVGYSSVNYSSSDADEIVVEIGEDELSAIFNEADVNALPESGESIESAIDDPLAYRDFLILDDNGEIAFNHDYEREDVA